MAETAPHSEGYIYGEDEHYASLPPGLDIYKTIELERKEVGRGHKKTIEQPIGVTKEEGLRVPITSEHLEYAAGLKPWTKKESKEATTLEKAKPAKDKDTETEKRKKSKEKKEEDFPKKAIWDNRDSDVPVTVTELAGERDGKKYYWVTDEKGNTTGVHEDKLEFQEETESKEKKLSELSAKERALHPETIIRLKEEFDKRLKEQMKGLESLKKHGRLAEYYEKAEESTGDLLRAAIVEEYLQSLSEEDQKEVESLRNSIINSLKDDYEALEIKRNMMKTADGSTAAEKENKEEFDSEFKPGQSVKVKRSNGNMEDGWQVADEKPFMINDKKYIPVIRKDDDVVLRKDVLEEDLREWQGTGTAEDEYDYEWEPQKGDIVIVKRGDGIFENDWRIEDIIKDDSGKILKIRAVKGVRGAPYQEITESYETFLKWQVEAGSVEDETDPEDNNLRGKMKRAWERAKHAANWPFNRVYQYIFIEAEDPKQQKRRLFGVLGAGILIGALIDPIEDYFEAKHGVPKSGLGRHFHEHGQHGHNSNFGHDGHHAGINGHDADVFEDRGASSGPAGGDMNQPGQGLGNAHEKIVTTRMNADGHRYVQSFLPDELIQKKVNGVPQIIDRDTGKVIADHVGYQGNGAYDQNTLRQIHQAGWDTRLVQNPIFDADGGPGPKGLVNGRWASEVLAKNNG